MDVRTEVGATLRRLREARGLSLEQLARRVGLGKTGVQAIESGRSGAPLDRLQALASALGASLVVEVRAPEAAALERALQAAVEALPEERRALLLRVARAAADVDDVLLRGAVEGLEAWARAARAARAHG